MKAEFLSKIPWLSLGLVGLTHVLLGWYLSAYHYLWSVWFFIGSLALTLLLLGGGTLVLWFEQIRAQGYFFVLTFTAVACLAATWSTLFTLLLIAFAAEFLARVDLRAVNFSKIQIFWIRTITAGLGLGFGWSLGMMLIPSSKYWLGFMQQAASRQG